MLKQRIITAIILGTIITLAVFKLPNHFLALILALITLSGVWEWTSLVGPRYLIWKVAHIVFIAILLMITWVFIDSHHMRTILFIAGLWWAGVVILLAMYEPDWLQTGWLHRVLEFSSFVVLIPAWLALIILHKQGSVTLMFLLGLVWIADSGAYFIGKRFGKNKLAAELSPGKSREGLYGALIASSLFTILGIHLFSLDKKMWVYFICLCLLTVLISVIGDLYESLLKRKADVKNSGTVLPGHGGILDRIDSLTAAAPGFALGLYWMT